MPLSRSDHVQFVRDGYLVIDTGLAPAVLRGAREDPLPHYGADGRLLDFWPRSRAVQAVAVAPRVLDILRDLYGRTPLPFQTLNFSQATQQRAHSDTIHFNSTPAGYMCGVWVALEDIHEESGPLLVYPGSHGLPEITLVDAGIDEEPREPFEEFFTRHYPAYEDRVERAVSVHGLRPHTVPVAAGQAIVWAANLLHGGSRRLDPALSRHSQVTHYFFADCEYYTPGLSRPGRPFRRAPNWIPAPG
jgi:ectoine hydroxylase-related dioxygenase (phytanoyl-CoA dioxygenase family)